MTNSNPNLLEVFSGIDCKTIGADDDVPGMGAHVICATVNNIDTDGDQTVPWDFPGGNGNYDVSTYADVPGISRRRRGGAMIEGANITCGGQLSFSARSGT